MKRIFHRPNRVKKSGKRGVAIFYTNGATVTMGRKLVRLAKKLKIDLSKVKDKADILRTFHDYLATVTQDRRLVRAGNVT